MKIYQIFKASGCYDDYHRYAIATYLHRSRAESELERLRSEVPDCDECVYNEWIDEQELVNCPHFKLETIEDEDEEKLYSCKNCINSYDAPSYSIEEFEVDESGE